MAILAEEEVVQRFESPMNLFQRLRKQTTSRSESESLIVSIPKPHASELIPDIDEKLNIAGSKTKALSIMSKVLNRLDNEIESIESKRLPLVVKDMAVALKAMEPESESKSNNVQFIIYSPSLKTEADYGTPIEVKE